MANDLWRTPPEVFNKLNEEFNFLWDVASSDENHLCENYFTERDDALSKRWDLDTRDIDKHITMQDYIWCNPPYSNPMPWVKKALEAQKDGLGVVMLLNNDDSVGWFAEALKGVSEIRRIVADEKPTGGYASGRLAFINEEGKTVSGNNKPQFILVFNPFKIRNGNPDTVYIPKSHFYKTNSK